MNKQDFISALTIAANSGTLMTLKHDPSDLTAYSPYRTVLSFELAAKLDAFIQSGKFDVTEYSNSRHPSSPLYMEITPRPGLFSVPTSGITAQAAGPPIGLDRIVAVSGASQGWHLYGEDSREIQRRVVEGTLLFRGPLL